MSPKAIHHDKHLSWLQMWESGEKEASSNASSSGGFDNGASIAEIVVGASENDGFLTLLHGQLVLADFINRQDDFLIHNPGTVVLRVLINM